MKNLTLNTPQGGGVYPYIDLTDKTITMEKDPYKYLYYNPGNNIDIVGRKQYFESIIVDGEEKITENSIGILTVDSLINPEIKVRFKSGIESVKNCFERCEVKTIPENLFWDNPEITDFSNCFLNSDLISIPEKLFANNSEVTNFENCFGGCHGLIEIPKNLFVNNPKTTNFFNCFNSCLSLTSIPEGLFSNNQKVITFYRCFMSCDSLSIIPENLFYNNPEVINFGFCFSGCPSLTTISKKLFSNNTKVTNFESTFEGCSSLTIMPIDNDGTPIYNRSKGKEGYVIPEYTTGCFRNCPNLEGYDQILNYWK